MFAEYDAQRRQRRLAYTTDMTAATEETSEMEFKLLSWENTKWEEAKIKMTSCVAIMRSKVCRSSSVIVLL